MEGLELGSWPRGCGGGRMPTKTPEAEGTCKWGRKTTGRNPSMLDAVPAGRRRVVQSSPILKEHLKDN